jgi:tRNA(Ser,Leu) C12 N-acetylase TAN1
VVLGFLGWLMLLPFLASDPFGLLVHTNARLDDAPARRLPAHVVNKWSHRGTYHLELASWRPYGRVATSGFFNVLLMQVEDPRALLEALRTREEQAPGSLSCLARVAPVDHTFGFQSVEEFESQAGEAVQDYVPLLAGKSFHVRMHRRGLKGRLSSHDEERRLAERLLERLERTGQEGHIAFTDADAVVDVETVGTRAGTSVWLREDVSRHPLLHPD